MIIINFENSLFKNHSCIACDREIIDGSKFSMCRDCLEKLKSLEINNNDNLTGSKSSAGKKKYNFDNHIAFYNYGDISSTIIKKLKYSNKKYYSSYIAEMMTKDLSLYFNYDYITFVPSSRRKLKTRGFNQAEEIAKEISSVTKIPLVSLLIKVDDTKNQAELSKSERLNNLKNSFEIVDSDFDIKGKNIIIIDDVFTTGTTLDRCSEKIKTLKPNKLTAVTFAKTVYENKVNKNV